MVHVEDIRRRCLLEKGPVLEALKLEDALGGELGGGEVICLFDYRETCSRHFEEMRELGLLEPHKSLTEDVHGRPIHGHPPGDESDDEEAHAHVDQRAVNEEAAQAAHFMEKAAADELAVIGHDLVEAEHAVEHAAQDAAHAIGGAVAGLWGGFTGGIGNIASGVGNLANGKGSGKGAEGGADGRPKEAKRPEERRQLKERADARAREEAQRKKEREDRSKQAR